MPLAAVPHLNFRSRAREALAFYRSVFGGEMLVMTYGQAGAATRPSQSDEVMWGQVATDDGLRVMAYDVQPELPWDAGANPFYVAVTGDDAEALTLRWTRLCEGGSVQVDLAPTSWAPLYGKVTDKFGVTWVLSLQPAHAD